jgi:hypothetical protein
MQGTVNTSSLLTNIINDNNFKKYDGDHPLDLTNLAKLLSEDLYYIYVNIIDSFDIVMGYKSKELSISIDLIQKSSRLNEDLFAKAIEYYDKYEKYLIDNEIYDISVDFNVTTKNENVKIITAYTR